VSTTAPAPSPDLKIISSRVYRGPNIWHYEPAIQLVVDLGALEDFPTNLIPGFTDALLERLPGLQNHSCSRGHRGGFVERLREGTWLGHVAEHVALQLQQAVGHDVRRGKTRQIRGERGRYNVIYAYVDESVGLAAGELAVRLINDLIEHDPAFDFAAELERFIVRGERTAFGPSTQAIVDEAVSRDIPYLRLNAASLVQLGQGVHQQRIRATMTSVTPSIAVDIASNKELTLSLLSAAGLPVPRSQSVRTVEDAVRLANRIGYPVVVKPLDGNHGRGVMLDLRTDDDVRKAFVVAKAESRGGSIIVETYVTGRDYRCLVIAGKIAAIAERVPAHVIGDGVLTVRELVDKVNADPRRGVGHEKVLTRIKIDQAAIDLIAAQGYRIDDAPPKDTMIKLTLTGNMSTGGISIDRTFEAHPENIEIAEEAARVVGLDIAGIDFITPDITQPVRETGGGICEVNAAPGFRMHTHPTIGDPQYVAKPVIDMLFPPGTPSRIPIIAVTGTNGKTTTARMIAHIFKGIGKKVGMTSTDGVVVDERLIIRSDASGPRSAKMVLQNPRVDFAVFEVARGGILREGLGYERNDVGVVLNVQPDHLGLRGVETLEQLADVKAVVVEAVPRNGFAVLNADDPLVRGMRKRCSGRIVWFTMAEPGSAIRESVDDHCRRGGRAVVVEHSELGDMIVVKEGRRSMQLAWTHLLPATFGGRATMNVQNSLAAAAAAFAAGASLHDIRQGLRSFSTNYYLSPGRLNEVSVEGRTVIVDYCHNAPGMRMLGDFVDKTADALETTNDLGRVSRIGVIATAGDRRDSDMRELGEIAARHFDVVIVREDRNPRGRRPGEVAALIAEGVRDATGEDVRCKQVEIVLDELEATRHAIARSNTGDLIVICVDQHAAVMAELESYGRHAQPGARRGADRVLATSVPDPDFAPDATHDEPERDVTAELR
jgi:cyanophycin synthetase